MKSTLIAIYFDCPFAAGSRHSDRAIRRMCVQPEFCPIPIDESCEFTARTGPNRRRSGPVPEANLQTSSIS